MKKNELKKLLKPLIKECIKEVIFEEGSLSTIISEVIRGTSNLQPILEQKPDKTKLENKQRRLEEQKKKRKKMLDAIGKDAYNGVNLFEGTTPMAGNNGSQHGPLAGTEPGDAGIDISNLMGNNKRVWNALMEGKK